MAPVIQMILAVPVDIHTPNTEMIVPLIPQMTVCAITANVSRKDVPMMKKNVRGLGYIVPARMTVVPKHSQMGKPVRA